MGKIQNKAGKFSHGKVEDRSRHWKFGKSSGNPEATARRKERIANRRRNRNKKVL